MKDNNEDHEITLTESRPESDRVNDSSDESSSSSSDHNRRRNIKANNNDNNLTKLIDPEEGMLMNDNSKTRINMS